MKKYRAIICIIQALLMLHMSIGSYAAVVPEEDVAVYNGSDTFNKLNKIVASEIEQGNSKYNEFIDTYAGSVIDETGKLIVYVQEKDETVNSLKNELYNANIQTSAIQFVDVEYSYNELKAYRNLMWDFVSQAKENVSDSVLWTWSNKLQAAAIDPATNKVELYVVGFGEADFELCEEYFCGYPYEIEILPEGYGLKEETTLNPGQAITTTGGSLGFRCKLDGVEGFVTATHGSTDSFVAQEKIVKVGAVTVGKITAGKFDGYADFAFVELTNPNYDVSTTTNTTEAYTLHETHYVVSLPVGYDVYMAGKMDDDTREGKVYRYDYTISSGSEWIVCDYPSETGDSGGCIFAEVNGDYCIIGIHDGSLTNTNYTYGTKLTTMQGYYNIVIY